jgi:hypothetical protein
VIPFLQIIFNDASTVITNDVPELSLSISAIVEFLQYHFNTIIVEGKRACLISDLHSHSNTFLF